MIKQIHQSRKLKQSNLCSEITLPTNDERTAVCCLSSVNLEHFDEWSKEEKFIDYRKRMNLPTLDKKSTIEIINTLNNLILEMDSITNVSNIEPSIFYYLDENEKNNN